MHVNNIVEREGERGEKKKKDRAMPAQRANACACMSVWVCVHAHSMRVCMLRAGAFACAWCVCKSVRATKCCYQIGVTGMTP